MFPLVQITGVDRYCLSRSEWFKPLHLFKLYRLGNVTVPGLAINQERLRQGIRSRPVLSSLKLFDLKDARSGEAQASQNRIVTLRHYLECDLVAGLGYGGWALIGDVIFKAARFNLEVEGENLFQFDWPTAPTHLSVGSRALVEILLDQVFAYVQSLGVTMRVGRVSTVMLGFTEPQVELKFGYCVNSRFWANAECAGGLAVRKG